MNSVTVGNITIKSLNTIPSKPTISSFTKQAKKLIEEKQAVKKSKNTLRKYRDSKLSTSLQILNYLFTELPETTRKRLEIIYNLEKSNDNIEAVFVSNNKKFIP